MKEAKVQNLFRLVNTQVTSIYYISIDEFNYSSSKTHKIKVSHDVSFPSDKKRNFIVIFYIEIFNDEKSLDLKITFKALFETIDEIDDNFKKSPIVEANAPAIAFPFVRSYISNFTINSGLKPIILPTINFTQISIRK